MKKILILGASVYQVPLILAAKRMGLYTIVASIPGEYPGFALADKVYDINTVDKEAILQVALDEKLTESVRREQMWRSQRLVTCASAWGWPGCQNLQQ